MKPKRENKSFLFLGIALLIWGLMIFFVPRYYHHVYGRYFDFTGYNVPFGVFVIAVGVGFIWTFFRTKNK